MSISAQECTISIYEIKNFLSANSTLLQPEATQPVPHILTCGQAHTYVYKYGPVRIYFTRIRNFAFKISKIVSG